jgi:hypothetical protein
VELTDRVEPEVTLARTDSDGVADTQLLADGDSVTVPVLLDVVVTVPSITLAVGVLESLGVLVDTWLADGDGEPVERGLPDGLALADDALAVALVDALRLDDVVADGDLDCGPDGVALGLAEVLRVGALEGVVEAEDVMVADDRADFDPSEADADDVLLELAVVVALTVTVRVAALAVAEIDTVALELERAVADGHALGVALRLLPVCGDAVENLLLALAERLVDGLPDAARLALAVPLDDEHSVGRKRVGEAAAEVVDEVHAVDVARTVLLAEPPLALALALADRERDGDGELDTVPDWDAVPLPAPPLAEALPVADATRDAAVVPVVLTHALGERDGAPLGEADAVLELLPRRCEPDAAALTLTRAPVGEAVLLGAAAVADGN